MASFGSKLINTVAALLLLLLMPAGVFAQESRQTFTWNKPASFITFNSITDNSAVGDERNFLQGRDAGSSTLADQITVYSGQEIVLQVYYDNDAGANLKLQAKNTRVKVTLPPGSSKTATVTGYVMADNARPASVSDTVTLTSDTPFSLSYEQGSAQIWNNVLRGAGLTDAVTGEGTLVGYNKIGGVILSGPQYSGYVTIKAKVNTQTAAGAAKVPNSGPGDVAALFLIITVLGAAGHHRWLAGRPRP